MVNVKVGSFNLLDDTSVRTHWLFNLYPSLNPSKCPNCPSESCPLLNIVEHNFLESATPGEPILGSSI